MKTTVVQNNNGIGLVGGLVILFAGLKLTGYIDWSWWWVFSPIWISIGLFILGVCLFFGGLFLYENYRERRTKSRHQAYLKKRSEDKK